MSTYTPFTGYRSVAFTANGNDTGLIGTFNKTSMVIVELTSEILINDTGSRAQMYINFTGSQRQYLIDGVNDGTGGPGETSITTGSAVGNNGDTIKLDNSGLSGSFTGYLHFFDMN